jgi:hypothetical protein
MKSKKKLFEDLETIDPVYFKDVNLNHPKIANETYGRKSCIYVRCESFETRRAIESKLERLGYKIDREYDYNNSRLEVQVSYFKGWHWDE